MIQSNLKIAREPITQEDIEEARREMERPELPQCRRDMIAEWIESQESIIAAKVTDPLLQDLLNTISAMYGREPMQAVLFCAEVAHKHAGNESISIALLSQLIDMVKGLVDS